MPGPNFNSLGKGSSVINNYFLDPVDNTEDLQQLITDNIKDGAKIYVASERKDYYYVKDSDSWELVPGQTDPEPVVIDQDNKNKFVEILETELETQDEAGIAAWLNRQDPPIVVSEHENLYLMTRGLKPMVMEYTTTAVDETVSLPFNAANFTHTRLDIDWGDGTSSVVLGNEQAKLSHNYAQAGAYEVKIMGESANFNLKYQGTKNNLTKIISWGDHKFRWFGLEDAINLTSLPMNETPDLSQVALLDSAFENTGLSQLPPDLFDKAGSVTDADDLFKDCPNITSIPAGFLDGLTSVTRMYAAFDGCSINTALPAGLFDYTTNITNLGYTFRSNSIPSIPAGLFDNMPLLEVAYLCFYENELAQLPAGLFKNQAALLDINYMFAYNNLTSIPAGLFDYTTNVMNLAYVFGDNLIEEIPAGLLNYTANVTTVSHMFKSNNLTTIPAGLFDFLPEVTSFSSTFRMNGLNALPADLFKNNTKATDFTSTFESNEILAIPAELFDATPNVTHFYRTFATNKISVIPEGLFNNNTAVTNFTSCFFFNDIVEVPAGLLDFTTEVTNVSGMFMSNIELTTIPANLFEKTTKLTDVSSLFSGATRLVFELSANFFAYSPNITKFDSTWYNCYNITGTAPAYWNDGAVSGTDCYYLCEQLTNYAAIPLAWK